MEGQRSRHPDVNAKRQLWRQPERLSQPQRWRRLLRRTQLRRPWTRQKQPSQQPSRQQPLRPSPPRPITDSKHAPLCQPTSRRAEPVFCCRRPHWPVLPESFYRRFRFVKKAFPIDNRCPLHPYFTPKLDGPVASTQKTSLQFLRINRIFIGGLLEIHSKNHPSGRFVCHVSALSCRSGRPRRH